jgi:hypothetical protein
MEEQLSLFDRKASEHIEPEPSRKHPAFWVKRLILLRKFAREEANLIQDIELHPGINILWARPEKATKKPKLGQRGMAGHASGKTTFCRFIRYILGERKFGTEAIQRKIREHFPEGHVAAEVLIDGEPWLVCIPFAGRQNAWCAPGATAAQLFDDSLKKRSYTNFSSALSSAVLSPLKVKKFPASESQIAWVHVLQWLTRDQECRFARLADWRDSSSESDAPELVAEERQHLMRAVLDILSKKEQDLLEENARLVTERDDAKKRVPLLQHQSRVDFARLKKLVRELRAPDHIDEVFFQQVKNRLADRKKSAEANYRDAVTQLKLPKLRQNRDNKSAELGRIQNELTNLRASLQGAENVLKAKRENPSAKLDALLGKYPSTELYCMVPIDVARLNCPLAGAPTLKFGKESAMLHLDEQIPALEKNMTFWKERIGVREKQEVIAQREFNTANSAHDEGLRKERSAFERLTSIKGELENTMALANNALNARRSAERLESSIGKLDGRVNKTYREATDIRQKRESEIEAFSKLFDLFIKGLMGEEVKGICEFSGRNISLRVENRGDVTSAAIETVKLLAFDLAAVASSVEGRGFHPRFLIHDGPREADMSSRIYDHFFILARLVEEAFQPGQPPSFQYIVTTTSPPPDDMREGSEWMLCPVLDASKPEGRLLKADLR